MICEKQLYHCVAIKDEDGCVIGYGSPVGMKVNYQPISGYVQALAYGSSQQRHWRYFAPTLTESNTWHVDDLVYLDGAEPVQGDANGVGANAKVVAVLPQNLRIRVLFEEVGEIG